MLAKRSGEAERVLLRNHWNQIPISFAVGFQQIVFPQENFFIAMARIAGFILKGYPLNVVSGGILPVTDLVIIGKQIRAHHLE